MSFKTLIGLLLLVVPATAFGQEDEEPPPLQIREVRAGFASYNPADGKPRMKVGMWTPVYVTLKAGKKGYPEKKGDPPPQIQVETIDSEDVGTLYTIDTRTLGPNEAETFIAYTRTGNLSAEIRVKVLFKGRLVEEKYPSSRAPSIGSLLVLSAGGTVSGLQDALDSLNVRKEVGPGGFEATKYAGQEGAARMLPDLALGYDGVDLLILCTSGKKFLKDLAGDRERVKAISRYVRNGGHLVVGLAHDTQDLVYDLLSSEGWQPPLPVKPPRSAGDPAARTYERMGQLLVWGRTDKPFPPARAVFAGLDPGKVAPGMWDVLVKTDDDKPVITRLSYGLGRITFLAFPLDDSPFKEWAGRQDFLKALLARSVAQEAGIVAEVGGRGNDVAGSLQRSMDQFDAQNVPFGLVALFIIVYILIVGPLDYFILKYVFKKLEWTWFTFPAVVLIVSIAAYYTAYSIRGNDQRINQIEIVDFDLRTDLDETGKTRKTHVYGQSFLTVLNPRIQAYTVGLEPNRAFFNLPEGKEVTAANPVTWFGRPSEEAWGMERAGSSSVLGKKSQPYKYAPEATGVEKVPVPVWTTKSLRASYEATLEKPPFEVDLTYPVRKGLEDRDVVLRGTFKNHLPADLMDVWFIYGARFYKVTQPIPGKGELKITLESNQSSDVTRWRDAGDASDVAAVAVGDTAIRPAPTSIVKSILFHDKAVFGSAQNHLVRTLDQSWRVEERPPLAAGDLSLREVIVYARLKQRQGKTEDLAQATDAPLPSRLWIGALPGEGATRPAILGTMTHDTYVRIILPVYPER